MSNNYSAERSTLWKLIAEVILSKYPSCPVVPLSWLQVHVTKMKTPDANYQESRLQEGKEMQQLRNVLDVRLIGFLACYILQTHWLNVGLAPGKRRKSISWKQKLTLTPAFRESDAPHRGVLPWYSPINFHKRTSLVSIVEAQECVFFFALCESPCLPGDRMINPMERVWWSRPIFVVLVASELPESLRSAMAVDPYQGQSAPKIGPFPIRNAGLPVLFTCTNWTQFVVLGFWMTSQVPYMFPYIWMVLDGFQLHVSHKKTSFGPRWSF